MTSTTCDYSSYKQHQTRLNAGQSILNSIIRKSEIDKLPYIRLTAKITVIRSLDYFCKMRWNCTQM